MQVVAVRLTTEELDALDAAAATNDMSRSEVVRAGPAHFAACRFTRGRSGTASHHRMPATQQSGRRGSNLSTRAARRRYLDLLP